MEAVTPGVDRQLERLVETAAAGDDVAFARIVAEHHGEMFRIASFICRDRLMAEDAVQAAWLIAWRRLDSVRDPARLRPWLVAIAVNEAKQLLRKRRRRARVEVPEIAVPEPGGIDPSTGVDGLALRQALATLSADDRALLAMRYIAGFDSRELGSVIGLSPPGTRARLARLLAQLRKELVDG